MKIGRNDKCWCDSGMKYKKCHLDRPYQKPTNFNAIWSRVRKKTLELKKCPVDWDRCSGEIINSHSIQRSKELSTIIDENNHVLTFHNMYKKSEDDVGPYVVGWREASTFMGFCKKHDDEIFKALEKKLFTRSREQCVLIGYRALQYALFTKESMIKVYPILRDLDQGKDINSQFQIQNDISGASIGNDHGINDLKSVEPIFHTAIRNKDFSSFKILILEYEGPLNFAISGATSPEKDFNGVRLQEFIDPTSRMEGIFIGNIAGDVKNHIIFVWEKSSQIINKFIASILSRNVSILGNLILQFLILHVENLYFSPHWWHSLTDDQQKFIRSLCDYLTFIQTYEKIDARAELDNLLVINNYTLLD